MARHLPRPHKREHKMTRPWDTAATANAAPIPQAQPGDENDGVQRMYDYIANAPQTPNERAYAALDAYADSAIHLAALCRDQKISVDECITMSKHFLSQTLAAADIVIGESVKNGHRPKGKSQEEADKSGED